jgi:YD repeat-containing protein
VIDVITGNQLGVISNTGTSLNLDSSPGQSRQKISVNAVTGNLSIQRIDQVLIGQGPDSTVARTYNSQGRLDDENGDNFRFSVQRRIDSLTGTVNTAGSTVLRTAEDGSQQRFVYRADLGCYLSTDGADAHDTLTYASGPKTWTYTEGTSKRQESYESGSVAGQWRLTRVQDTEGRTLTFSYNARGFVNRIEDSSGQTTFIDFSGNNVTRVRTQSLGVEQTTTHYKYDSTGRLSQVIVDLTPTDNAITDGNTYVTTFTYDGSSYRIKSISQSDDTVISFTYKLVGTDYKVESVTRGTGAEAVEIRFVYRTGATDIIRAATPGGTGPMTTVVYDSAGRLSQTIGATDYIGRRPTTTYTYDSDNNVRTIEEPGSRTTRFTYDTSGNLLETRDAAGNLVAQRTYRNNLLITETTYPRAGDLASGQTTHHVYDGSNRERFVVAPDRRVVETRFIDGADGVRTVSAISYLDEYAGAADLAALQAWVSSLDKSRSRRMDSVLDFRGQTLRTVQYDLVDAVSGEGIDTPTKSVTHYVYDQWGRLLQTIAPRRETDSSASYTTQYVYDGLGRLTQTTDPQSHRTIIAYNRNTVVTTHANNLQVQAVYSNNGDLLRETRADAAAPATVLGETRYVYDDLGRRRAVIDPTGAITHHMYDALGREIGRVESNGLLTETTYNLTGEAMQMRRYANPARDAALVELVRQVNSGVFTSTDGVWQLAQLRPTADTNNDRVGDFVYDVAGRLIYAVDAEGFVTESRYDAIGQGTETIKHDTALVSADRRARLWDPLATGGDPGAGAYIRDYLAGASTSASRQTTAIYDRSGRVVGSIDAEGYMTESVYNRFGQLIQTIRYGTRANAFDATGRIVNPTLLASRDLAALRPVLSDEDIRSYLYYDGKGQQTLAVDIAGRVTAGASALREAHVLEMTYDANGNLVEKLSYATARFERGGAYTEATFLAFVAELNRTLGDARLLSLDYVRPTQTSEQARMNDVLQYRYDNLNRLVRVIDAQGTETAYLYDAVGQRTQTTLADGTTESRTTRVDYDVLGRVRATVTPLAAAMGARSTANYDASGRVIRTENEVGNRSWNYYTAAGLLAYRVDGEGYVTGYLYNTFGEVTETVAYATRVSGDLSTLTGGVVNSAFLSRLVSSANDLRTKQTYTRRGALAQALSAEAAARGVSASVINQYNAFGEIVNQRQALDVRAGITDWRTTTFTYDHRGLATSTNAAGTTTRAEYDAYGRVRKSIDARGYASFLTYDGFGRIIDTVDAGGGRRQTTYDPLGRVLTQTDATGQVTRYRYDIDTNSISVITPEGIELTTVRNRHGQTVRIIDGKGQTSLEYEYDANGNAIRVRDALGESTVSRYDAANRLYETENALGSLVTFEYDDNNRIRRQVHDAGGLALTTVYTWDAFGRQTEVIDASGTVQRMQYNKDGLLTRVLVDPAGLALFTDYGYDLAGRCIRTARGSIVAGVATVAAEQQASYDALGRVIKEVVDPAGLNLITQHSYDGNGNRISTTNAAGDVSYTLYDVNNRPTYSLVPLRSAGVGAVEFAASQIRYDGEGRAISTIQYATPVVINDTNRHLTTNLSALRTYLDARTTVNDRTSHNVYDKNGRIAYVIDPERSLRRNVYDANGNVVETVAYAKSLPTSVAANKAAVDAWAGNPANLSVDDQHSWHVFDANNRRVYDVDPMGYVTQTQYDAAGRATRTVQYANAINPVTQRASDVVANAAQDRSTRVVYNAAGWAIYELDSLGFVNHYRYDAAGRVTQATRYRNAVSVGEQPSEADVASALRTDAEDRTNRSFYDAAGRVLYTLDAMSTLTSFTYDALGQVVGQRHYYTRYTGAPTLSGLAAHATHALDRVGASDYDKAGRLVAAYDGARTEPGVPIERYVYDALGNLIKKTDRRGHLSLYGYDKASRLIRTVRQRDAGAPTTKLKAYVVDYEYDALGNQTAQIQYMNAATLFYMLSGGGVAAYSAMQVVVTPNTDPVIGDRTTRYVYNRRGQQTKIQSAIGSIATRTDYDAFGRSIRVVAADGLAEQQTTESVYDRRNQLLATIVSPGRAEETRVELRYDAFGQLTEEVGANGIALADSNADWARSWRMSHGYAANAASLSAADKRNLRGLYTAYYIYDQHGNRTSTLTPQWGAELSGRVPDALPLSGTESLYDQNGNLVRTTDAAGARRFYYYDLNNRLSVEVDELGFAVRTLYDSNGNVTEVRGYATPLSAGSYDETRSNDEIVALLRSGTSDRLTQHSYDARGRLESNTYAVEGAAVYTELFTYDAEGNRTSFTNKNGDKYNFEYDALNRVLKEITPSVRTVLSTTATSTTKSTLRIENRYEYDAVNQRVAEFIADNLDNQRQVRRSFYDKLGREVEQQVEDVVVYDTGSSAETTRVATTRRVFDALGQLLCETDAAGNQSFFFYDSVGRRIAFVDSLNVLQTIAYDASGASLIERTYGVPLSSTPTAGGAVPVPIDGSDVRTMYYTRDAKGRVVETRTDNVVMYNVDDLFYERAVKTQWVYDARGSIAEFTDGEGNKTHYFYDLSGNNVLEIGAGGYAIAREYARGDGLVTSEIRFSEKPNAERLATLLRDRDLAGLLAMYRDSANVNDRATIYQYDRLGRLAKQTLRNVTFHKVDAVSGELSPATVWVPLPGTDGWTVLDGDPDISTTYERDGEGRVTRITSPDGTSQTTSYDALGRASKTEGTTFTDYLGNSVQETTEYFYTAHGQVAETVRYGSSGATIITRASYDRYGQLKETWDPQYGARLRNYYDISGNLIRSAEQVYQRDGSFREDISTSRYDAMNRLVLMQDPAGVKHVMGYNAYGDVARRGRYSGMDVAYQEFFVFDAAGRLQYTNAEDGVEKMRFYDDNGNLTLEIKSGQRTLSDFVKTPDLPQAKESKPSDKDAPTTPGPNPGIDPKEPIATIDPHDRADIVPLVVPEDLIKDFVAPAFIDIDFRPRNDVVLGLSPGDVQFTVYHYDGENRLEGTFAQPKIFGDLVSGSVPPEEHGLYYLKALRDYHGEVTETGARPANEYIVYHSQTYDAFGQITSQTDARGNTTDFVYNKLGNVIRRIDPEVDVAVYGDNGERTDASGLRRPVSEFYYDSMGRRIGVRDARGNVLETVFIENGKVSKTFRGGAFSYTYGKTDHAYDAFGNLRREKATVNYFDADLLTTEYTYDKNGNRTLITKTLTEDTGSSARPHIFSLALGDERLTDVTVEGTMLRGELRALDMVRESYLYDNHGNRIVHVDGAGRRESYVYDQANRIIEHHGIGGVRTRYEYRLNDLGGYTKTETLPGGDSKIDWSDYFGRAVKHKNLGNVYFDYVYNNAGWLLEYQYTPSYGGAPRAIQKYEYFDNGWQKLAKSDAAEERYDYDQNGNRTYEYMFALDFDRAPDEPYYTYREGETFQESHVTYDALNRITDIVDPFYRVHYEYDEMGNRTRVDSRFTLASRETPISDPALWGKEEGRTQFFSYDALNRVAREYRVAHSTGYVNGTFNPDTYLDGPLDGEIPIYGRDSNPGYFAYQTKQYYYDHFDRRVFESSYGLQFDDRTILEAPIIDRPATTERYYYNVLGLLEGSETSFSDDDERNAVLQFRDYDGAGNLTYKVSRKTVWDEDGREFTTDRSKTLYAYDSYGNVAREHELYRYASGTERARGMKTFYDGAQRIAYTQNYGDHDTRTDYTYEAFDSYQVSELRQTSAGATGRGIYSYDVIGRVESYWDERNERWTEYVNRVGGKTQARLSRSDRMHFAYLGGNNIGHIGTWRGATDFGFTQSHESSSTPSAVQMYEVRSGDTLHSIAADAYGDSSLWYIIADANGLAGDETLAAGTRLTIPTSISSHNGADNFRPYDAQLALGNNSIGLQGPPPSCEQQAFPILAAIIAIVVAIVVAVVSYGTLSGVSVGIGLLGSAALGAAAGAVTSAATQGIAIAVGLQKEFDWAAFATSTLMGALSGMGSYGLGQLQQVAAVAQAMNGASGLVLNALKGAAVAAVEQASSAFVYEAFDSAIDGRGFDIDNVADRFDWRGVAMGAVGGFGQALLGPVNTRAGGPGAQNLELGDFERSMLYGAGLAAMNEGARAAIYGEAFDPSQLLLNAAGNTFNDFLGKGAQIWAENRERERQQREFEAMRSAILAQRRAFLEAYGAESRPRTEGSASGESETPSWMLENVADGTYSLDVGESLTLEPMSLPYVVERGDTWSGISESFYGDPRLFPAIAAESGQSLDRLRPGDLLWVPPPETFDVSRVHRAAARYYEYRHSLHARAPAPAAPVPASDSSLPFIPALAVPGGVGILLAQIEEQQQLRVQAIVDALYASIDYSRITIQDIARATNERMAAMAARPEVSVHVDGMTGERSILIVGPAVEPGAEWMDGYYVDVGDGLVRASREEYAVFQMQRRLSGIGRAFARESFELLTNPYTIGTLQIVGGVMEGISAVGLAAIPTPFTEAAALGLALHAGDTIGTGVLTLWTGEAQSTLTQQGLAYGARSAGFSDDTAEILATLGDAGISLGGGLLEAAGPSLLRSTARLGAAESALALVDDVPILTPDLVISSNGSVMDLATGTTMHIGDDAARAPLLLGAGDEIPRGPLLLGPGDPPPFALLPADSAVLPPLDPPAMTLTPPGAPDRVLITPPPSSSGRVLITPPPGADPMAHLQVRGPFPVGRTGAWNFELNNPAPYSLYMMEDGSSFMTDDLGRMVSASAPELRLDAAARNGYQQRIAGGMFRWEDDVGAHGIPNFGNGTGEGINLTAGNRALNGNSLEFGVMGRYELNIRQALGRGEAVTSYRHMPMYLGRSLRPFAYDVTFEIGGNPSTYLMWNRPGG